MPPGGPSPLDDRQLYQFVYSQLSLGKNDAEIQSLLVGRGVQSDKAQMMVQTARSNRKTSFHNRGKKRIRNGIIAIAIGVVITVVTLLVAASSATGGTYIVAYGPILIGIYLLAAGISDMMKR